MAIISLTLVETDLEEYSQYERTKDTVTVLVRGTPAAPINGDEITIELRKARRNRDYTIAQTTYEFDGSVTDFDTVGVEIEFELNSILSSPDLFRLAKAGQYFIYVYDSVASTTNESSDDFDVSLITVDRMKREFLFGIDLQSSEIRTWKLPPRTITGVTLLEVSRNHPLAFFPLSYTIEGTSRYLSWGEGGPGVSITPDTKQTYILPTAVGQEYILIEVDARYTPAASCQELLLVEESDLSNETIRSYIKAAADQIENSELQVLLEPTRCVTDIDPTQITFSPHNLSPILLDADWDKVTSPVTYYLQDRNDWIQIKFPFRRVLSVDQLFGMTGNTRIVDINLEWLELSETSGYGQLVPLNQEIAWDFLGLVFVTGVAGARCLPNFWHYSALVGLRDVPGEVLQWLGREAAIPILTVAGQAFRSGVSSMSLGRDGISESVSYTSSAIYGIYSASIEDHRRWIRENGQKIRDKYRGIPLAVI